MIIISGDIPEDKFYEQRQKMIETQLKSRGIENEKVLKAFLDVPRHKFVPDHLKEKAYEDRPLPIGEGQTISQPYIVAEMISALAPESKDKVLEVGCGSGYAAAILAQIVNKVYGLERIKAVAEQAKKNIAFLKYENIEIELGDGTKGWPEAAPYDGILVSAAAPDIPDSLLKQLKTGGYMCIPVGGKNSQKLLQIKKIDENEIEKKNLGRVRFVPLIGEKGWDDRI